MRPFVSLVSAAVAALAIVGLSAPAAAQTGQAVRVGSVHPDSAIGRFVAMRMDVTGYAIVGERGSGEGQYWSGSQLTTSTASPELRIEAVLSSPCGQGCVWGRTAVLFSHEASFLGIVFDDGSLWHGTWPMDQLDVVREAFTRRCALVREGSRWQFCESLPDTAGAITAFRRHRLTGSTIGQDPISTTDAVRVCRSEDGILTTVTERQPTILAIDGATTPLTEDITAVQPLPVDGGTLLTTAEGRTFYIERHGSEPVSASLLPAQGERIDSRPWRYLGGAAWYGPKIATTLVADVEADPSDPDADIVVLRDVLGRPDVQPVTASGQPIRFPGRVIELGVMSRRIDIPVAAGNTATLYGAVVAIMADSSVYVFNLGLPTSVDGEDVSAAPAIDVRVQPGTVDIRVVDAQPGCRIRVVDLLGTTVADGDGGTLRAHGLASGTYVVQAVNGRRVHGQAVVVTR